MTSSCALRTFRHPPLLAVLLAVSFGAHAQAPSYKMRIPVGPIAAAAPAPDISIPGYNPVAGTFQSAQGSFTWNGTAYGVTTATAFGYTGPVTLTPAVTAAAAKAAMRDNPGSLAGTLAEGWLADQDFSLDGGAWFVPNTDPVSCGTNTTCTPFGTSGYTAVLSPASAPWPHVAWGVSCTTFAGTSYNKIVASGSNVCGSANRPVVGENWAIMCWTCTGAIPISPVRSATQGDWDALLDPLPTVAPELPYAPYMPAGVPVDQNNFQILDLDTGTTHNCTNGGCV